MAKAKTKTIPLSKATKGIAPSYEGKVPVFYANFASVSSSMREVFIDFCLISPPYEMDQKQQVKAPVAARIIANREFAQALNEAIKTRLDMMSTQEASAKGKSK